MKNIFILFLFIFSCSSSYAQDEEYFTKPKEELIKKKDKQEKEKQEKKRLKEEKQAGINREASGKRINTDSIDRKKVFYRKRNNFSIGIGFYNLVVNTQKKTVEESQYLKNATVSFEEIKPLFFKYEFAIKRRFSLGLNFSYHKWTSTDSYLYDLNRNNYNGAFFVNIREITEYKAFTISLKTNWHFAVGKHFEMYGGPGIGLNIKTTVHSSVPSVNGDYISNTDTKPGFNIYPKKINGTAKETFPFIDISLGARGYVTKNIGIYVEFAAVKALFQTGIVVGF